MSSTKTIRVGGVPEHFNLPWHLAIERGSFASLDIDVEFIEYPGGTGAMTKALAEDQLDIAILLFEGAVSNILRGHANQLVKVYVESPLIWGIHVSANSKIRNENEIRDQVYAISRAGSGSHLIAIVDAAERGWSISDMKFSKVNNLDGAREKLENGKVDVFLWERFMTQPLVDSGEFRRVGERVVPWPAFVVSVRESVLEKHAEAIKQMLQIIDQTSAELKQDPEAVSMISNRYHLKVKDTKQWLELVEWGSNFDRPDKTIKRVIGYLERVNIIESTGAGPDDVWKRI